MDDKFKLFAQNTVHVPVYDDFICIFCKYSKEEHNTKMKELAEELNKEKCDHVSSYPAHGKWWSISCEEAIKK